MAPARLLERNVRPARTQGSGSEDDLEEAAEASADESSDGEQSAAAPVSKGERSSSEEEVMPTENEGDAEQEMINVSFVALKQAQDALSKKRKRGSDTTAEQEEKLEAIRARLKEIRSGGRANNKVSIVEKGNGRVAKTTVATRDVTAGSDGTTDVGFDDEDDSDSAPSEEEVPTKARTSKHAPTSRSSKYQVTRKRNVVDVPKRVFRDPRFDALHQSSAQPSNNEKAYSFLRDYQKTEIADLKSAIKQARNEDDKETLKRKVISMENRIKSHEAKEREQEILRRHRKEEKEKVQQGKQPFYLKKKDLKERVLVEKYQGMKSKDRERLLDKRRRKESQREKRQIPQARRVIG